MSRSDCQRLVGHLAEAVRAGYTLLTWNGLGFDFDVLAEESAAIGECKELARGHVDMMFHVLCTLGYPVALDKAAQGMGLSGKLGGMSGIEAPRLWLKGRHQEVLDYVAQDARTTLELGQLGEKRRALKWITRKGTPSRMPLEDGWLPVADAMKLPKPDTSWMRDPPSRRDFAGWLSRK